jgi:membrane protein implicated in regulation of membrane protease activity
MNSTQSLTRPKTDNLLWIVFAALAVASLFLHSLAASIVCWALALLVAATVLVRSRRRRSTGLPR